MKVSIITAVRNGIDTVADAIGSVHAQQYPHIEHILMDGASTDGTAALLMNVQSRNRAASTTH